jgi:hypothetical protein
MIARIVQLSGPVPDAEAYAKHLGRLAPADLAQKLQDLQQDGKNEPTARVSFWRPKLTTASCR